MKKMDFNLDPSEILQLESLEILGGNSSGAGVSRLQTEGCGVGNGCTVTYPNFCSCVQPAFCGCTNTNYCFCPPPES